MNYSDYGAQGVEQRAQAIEQRKYGAILGAGAVSDSVPKIRVGLMQRLHEQEVLLEELASSMRRIEDVITPIRMAAPGLSQEKASNLARGSDSPLFNLVTQNNETIRGIIEHVHHLAEGIQL